MLRNKRILFTLSIAVLLLLIPSMVNAVVTAATETTTTSTGVEVTWSYELDGENAKNLKCTNIDSVTGNLTIPATIDEHPVLNIGYQAFVNCTGLTGVTISDGITAIGNEAFKGCSGIRNVSLPDTLTSIGSYAFKNCTGISTITIPNSVTTLGDNAFYSCSGLRSIVLSNNLTILNNETFGYCTGLTEIVLPDNLTTIGTGSYEWYSPFEKCTALKFIKIPENVVSIANEAFKSCENLIIFGKEGSTAETYANNNNIKFEKIENWDNRNAYSGLDIVAPTVKSMVIKHTSVMDYYNSTTNDYRVPKGAELQIIIEFTEQVKGTETPTLTIKCGEGSNVELKNGTISDKNIVYTYTIQEKDKGLITVVELEGGNITDNAGNEALLSKKELVVQYGGGYAYAEGDKATTQTPTDNKDTETSDKEEPSKTESEKEEEKKDNTVAPGDIPYTGGTFAVIMGIVLVLSIGIYVYKRNNDLRGI